MASFPIFIDVASTPPLVAGGGELALTKARLLLKRAPRIELVSHAYCAGIRALSAEGRAILLPGGADAGLIRGRPLVISATGDEGEDARISALARELGVPVNVPDRPDLSTFALPAIVDRYPVTVAIGTEGTAPVLATRLRAEIESLLHPRLGRLARIAQEFRAAAAAKLPSGSRRRDFWNAVFGGAAARAVESDDDTRARQIIQDVLDRRRDATPEPGRVLLVGAGPGDPDLLTVKAVRALKNADVILHDGVMGPAVLEHARREAVVISVAKAKGRHSRTQAEINALLVANARDGKTVVRLKGGDPSIFGRSGEEVDALRAAGVTVEIIPGVTAASAAAAYLQIPLTHRNISRSLTFISGHAAGDGEAEFDQVDFAALSRQEATLAVYMGLSSARVLAGMLLDSGWSRATPVIAIASISQAHERRVATTLDVLAGHDRGFGLAGPALLLIGEVAGLPIAGVCEVLAPLHIRLSEPAHA